MKDRLRILPMKALAAFCLLQMMLPVFLLMGQGLLPDDPMIWYIPPLFSLIWGICGFMLPVKGRTAFALTGCVLLLAGAYFFLLPKGWQTVLLIVPCIVFLFLLPPSWARPFWDEWSSSLWLAGVVMHLGALIVSGSPRYSPAAGHFMAALVIYFFLFLLFLNRQSIRDGMHGSEKAPAALKQRNTLLLIGFFLIGALAACWKTLGAWVDQAWQLIKRIILIVLEFIMRFFPERSMGAGGGGGGADMLAELGEGSEPNAFALFMEKVFMVLAAILLIALLVLAIRVIFKTTKELWKRLVDRLRRYAADSGEDYIDEAESTLNWDERTQSVLDRLQKAVAKPRQPKWEELDGRGRIRRLYQQFLRRKPEEKNKTAREALKSDKHLSSAQIGSFTQLYEKARYRDHDISTQEADQLKSNIRL
ncbi:MAG: hypothetical protein Q4G00_02410 [Clostridia bacterium]|nr:hypothetical protein [Clostridia bacterium]